MNNLSKRMAMANEKLSSFYEKFPEGTKPNFSAVAAQTGLSRHTISRLWKTIKNPAIEKKPGKPRPSKFDPFKDEITQTLQMPGATIKAAFTALSQRHGEEFFNNYNSFKSYVRTHQLFPASKDGLTAGSCFQEDEPKQV